VIDSNNRFTGDLIGNVRSNGTTKSPTELIDAYTRATTGLNASGVVQVAVPSAQISGALTTVLTASPTNTAQWTTNDGAIYSPTGTNFDITVTADNGINSETCVIRWSYVNVSNSNADYISACTEQTDSSNAFTLGSITDLSGNNVKFATCVVTHTASGTTITLQALLSQIHVSGGGK
jgi:Fe-S cluster assembly scaffold protein SufB